MSELFPTAIETERLRLERASRETVDLLRYYEICSSDPGIEEVTEYVPWDPHETPKETLEFFERKERQFAEGEKAPYVVRLREGEEGPGEQEDGAGTIAGQCGLRPDWDRRSCVLNLWLRKRFWGRGYSGERAAAMFELAFDRLDLELAAANVLVDNENSRRAIETYVDRFGGPGSDASGTSSRAQRRDGGQRDGLLRNNFVVDGEPVDQYRYSVTREEWAANRPEDLEVRFYD